MAPKTQSAPGFGPAEDDTPAGFGPAEDAAPAPKDDAAPADTRNAFQRGVDTLSTVTPEQRAGHGHIFNAAQTFGANVIGAAAAPIAHPIQTAKSIFLATPLGAGIDPRGAFEANPVVQGVKQIKEQGAEQAIPAIAGQVAGGAIAGESAGGAMGLAPRVLRGTADAISGTGPRVTKALVKETTAANTADAAQTVKDNNIESLKAEAKRRTELSKHAADTATHEAGKVESNAKLQKDLAAQREIAPTEKKLADAKSARQAAVETARENARRVGNEKYGVVHTLMDDLPARDGFYGDVTKQAEHGISGSKGAPTILKAMAKRMESGKPVVYQDLQSDYSTLGNELSKGTLPGDVFTTYSDMHDAIGEEMQRMADSEGTPVDLTKVPRRMVEGIPTDEPAYKTDIGKHVYDTRNYWRLMKQTFGKTKIINDAATKAIGGAKDEAQDNQMRLLGSFDPQIPQIHSLVNTLEARAKALPKPVPERVLTRNVAEARTAPPKLDLTPRPEPKLPAPRKINAEDVQPAKKEARLNRADTFRTRGGGLASTFLVLDAIRNAFHGNIGAIGEDIGARAAFGVGKQSLARLLENPKVAAWLDQASERDVAAIPPELRGNFPALVKAAQAKGVKVSPALLGIAAVSGLPAPRAQNPTDAYASQ